VFDASSQGHISVLMVSLSAIILLYSNISLALLTA